MITTPIPCFDWTPPTMATNPYGMETPTYGPNVMNCQYDSCFDLYYKTWGDDYTLAPGCVRTDAANYLGTDTIMSLSYLEYLAQSYCVSCFAHCATDIPHCRSVEIVLLFDNVKEGYVSWCNYFSTKFTPPGTTTCVAPNPFTDPIVVVEYNLDLNCWETGSSRTHLRFWTDVLVYLSLRMA